jgi:hypothetical protein
MRLRHDVIDWWGCLYRQAFLWVSTGLELNCNFPNVNALQAQSASPSGPDNQNFWHEPCPKSPRSQISAFC